ncbi:hypothetical protein L484_005445 [Morus notabilis]|uniref:Uncharacterized protein n=1 Tax=Morus notabilis TaxID=981085 RepID=W9RC55_9ROSA|nr:hypothetical protein L484_005445 [Morus notabilis]
MTRFDVEEPRSGACSIMPPEMPSEKLSCYPPRYSLKVDVTEELHALAARRERRRENDLFKLANIQLVPLDPRTPELLQQVQLMTLSGRALIEAQMKPE